MTTIPASPDITSMTLSVEQERDSLQEKVGHLKNLLKQYYQELQSQKIRKEGVETVSKLLQESKHENNLLQKRNKTLETAIRNLQSRLTSNGLSDSITLEEGDMFMPGTSQQLLDNLARENARLRTLVKNASVDPEEINKLQQVIRDYITENDDLKQSVSTYQSRNAELERLLNSSDSQKDAEISRLRTIIQNMQSDSQTRDVLCHSLAEETNNLRSQLREVAVRCQEMARKLDQGENSLGKHDIDRKGNEQLAQTNSENIYRLREENRILQSKAEEVTKMNKRWQEYNTQREKYVHDLENKLQESKARQVNPHIINDALDEAKRRLLMLEEKKRKLEAELEERNQQLILQSEHNERLRTQLISSPHRSGHNSDTETIEALKAQIQICTEDFESERRDREKAQSRLAVLEAELKQYKDRERYQPKLEVQQNRYLGTNQEFYNDFNQPGVTSGFQHEPQLAARGTTGNINQFNVVDGQNQLHTDSEPVSFKSLKQSQGTSTKNLNSESATSVANSMNDLIQPLPEMTLSATSLNDSEDEMEEPINTSSAKKSHTLNCPKCNQEFDADKHGDLLEHIEVCCD